MSSQTRGPTEGVIFARGSDTGGHTPYVENGKLTYVYNWLSEVQKLTAGDALPRANTSPASASRSRAET